MTAPDDAIVPDCPRCDSTHTANVDESHSVHLYRHTDDMAQCQKCGHMWAWRGRAIDDADEGLAFYVPTIDKGAERPECPKHGDAMQPTKFWPDEEVVQFKCPKPTPEEDTEVCQRIGRRPLVDASEVEA